MDVSDGSTHKIRKNLVAPQQCVAPRSPSLTEEIQDITECPICMGTYTDPRFLPCGHSFCLQCVEQMQGVTADKKKRDTVPCPVCRLEFNTPSTGLSALPKNYFLKRLSDLFQMTALSEEDITCGHCVCVRNQFIDEETRSCVQCEKCCEEHKRCGFTKNQYLNSSAPHGCKENTQEKSEFQSCKEHVGKQLDFYCLKCKKVICSSCSESHQQHDVQHVNKFSNQVTEEILGYAAEADSILKHFMARQQRMDDKKMEFLKELENTEAMILRRSKMLKDMIEVHTKTLLAELQTIQEAKLKEFETDKDDLGRHLIAAKSFMTFCSGIRLSNSPVAACNALNDVRVRRDEILKFHSLEMLQRDLDINVLLIHSELEDYLETKGNNFIGKVEAKIIEKVSDVLGPSMQVQSKISAQFIAKLVTDYRRVFGVTTLQNNIYVLCQLPNGILVYDYQAPYILKKEMKIEMIKSPFDIASCLKSQSLYIAGKEICVWKLNVQNVKLIRWLRCLDQPRRLSVSTWGTVLVVNSDCSLSIHAEDSQLISRIILPPTVRQPMHACETSEGNVIVCFKDDESLGICEVDRSGLVLHKFPSKEGLPIDGPLHLVLVSHDSILVADFSNDRVLLLDSLFLPCKVLLTEKKDDLFRPMGMCYDRSRRQLMVAHGGGLEGGTQVFIFDLIPNHSLGN